MELALNLLDPEALAAAGVVVIALVVFAETGLLFGIFLPGDSLLFTAGFLAYLRPELSIVSLLIVLPIAAIAGAQTGYWIGDRLGPALFRRPDGRIFRQAYLDRAKVHLERYGVGKAVVIARFVPFVRTLLNPLCGAMKVDVRRFTLFNVVGAVVWAVGLPLLGYALGSALGRERVENLHIDRYILPGVAVIVALSVIPVWLEVRKARRHDTPLSAAPDVIDAALPGEALPDATDEVFTDAPQRAGHGRAEEQAAPPGVDPHADAAVENEPADPAGTEPAEPTDSAGERFAGEPVEEGDRR